MKNLLKSAVITLLSIVSLQSIAQVSERSKTSFLADFGDVPDVSWAKGPQMDEATFTKKGVKQTAYYGIDSKLVGTTIIKKYEDLPAAAQKTIEKDYKSKGYVVGAVIMFDDNEDNEADMLLFGSEFEDADHYFVTVAKDGHEEILMVKLDGVVSYFKKVS